jgi:hypothetical protein
MNWSSLIFAAAMGASLAYYWAKGRHVYVGPVEYVRKPAQRCDKRVAKGLTCEARGRRLGEALGIE